MKRLRSIGGVLLFVLCGAVASDSAVNALASQKIRHDAGTPHLAVGLDGKGSAEGSAEGSAGPDFTHLDDAATRAAACDATSRAVYNDGDTHKILRALNEQGKCLEVILFGLAREFYDSNAFGRGGVKARIREMRETMEHLYTAIYSEPRTCAPNCGEVYQVWAAEAYVTSIRIMLDDMIDRLQDESPYHSP